MTAQKFRPRGPKRFAHQRHGLRRIIETRGIHALLFDPGTGKTMTTIDYMSLLALKAADEVRVLVIAPLAAVDTWVDQSVQYAAEGVSVWAEVLGGSITQKAEALADRGGEPFKHTLGTGTRGHGNSGPYPRTQGVRRSLMLKTYGGSAKAGPNGLPEPRLVLCSVNLDAFAQRTRANVTGWRGRTLADLMVEAVKRFKPDLIVVDESHRIKSPTGQTSKAIARLTPLCRRRIMLTGTVMPHSPLDVYAQWRFMEPTAFGVRQLDGSTRLATFNAFRGRYAIMGGYMGHDVKRFVNLDEMQAIMARNSTVAKKEDCMDLPPVTDTVVHVNLSPAEHRAYREMRDQLATALSSGALVSTPNRLAQLMRLRQITSGYLPDDTGTPQAVGDSKARTAADLVNTTLAGEKRVVVFCHFRPEIAAIAQKIAEPGTTVLEVTGDTPSDERIAIRKRFGDMSTNERLVLVCQIKTMSLAVNELVSACHGVFASLPQQRDDIEQARARLDRQGQTRPVTLWWLQVPGSVDEVIRDAYLNRTDLETAMLRHVQQDETQNEV